MKIYMPLWLLLTIIEIVVLLLYYIRYKIDSDFEESFVSFQSCITILYTIFYVIYAFCKILGFLINTIVIV